MENPGRTGKVVSINCSPGGVPKTPVPEALVTTHGLFGDTQANTKHHGGPMRAVCLFSLDRIQDLQAEGHPIEPGTTGENVTVAGIDWKLVQPGARFEIGETLLEMTTFTRPCHKIRESFRHHDFMRMYELDHPGWSRVYARVLREGMIRTGDTVTLTPAGAVVLDARRVTPGSVSPNERQDF